MTRLHALAVASAEVALRDRLSDLEAMGFAPSFIEDDSEIQRLRGSIPLVGSWLPDGRWVGNSPAPVRSRSTSSPRRAP